MSGRLLYFAYGSNMLSWRLRHEERCPSARRHAVGTLQDFALRFHKRGADGSGKCDVFPTEPRNGSTVHGVVYALRREELRRLDAVEGPGYERRAAGVALSTGERVEAFLYVAYGAAIDAALRPFTWYRDLVVAGAREHALEASYVQRLAAQTAVSDADAERDARERRAIEGWLGSLKTPGE